MNIIYRKSSASSASFILVRVARKICSPADSVGFITPVPLNYVLSVDCLQAGEISASV